MLSFGSNNFLSGLFCVGGMLFWDSGFRLVYFLQTKHSSSKIQDQVKSGEVTPKDGAQLACDQRNIILNDTRRQSSPIGRSVAIILKDKAIPLEVLRGKYAYKFFSCKYADLNNTDKAIVDNHIIVASSRTRISATFNALVCGVFGYAILYYLGLAIREGQDIWPHATSLIFAWLCCGGITGKIVTFYFGPYAGLVVALVGSIFGTMGGLELCKAASYQLVFGFTFFSKVAFDVYWEPDQEKLRQE